MHTVLIPAAYGDIKILARRLAFADGDTMSDFNWWRERLDKLEIPYCIVQYPEGARGATPAPLSMFIDNARWARFYEHADASTTGETI